MAAPIAPLEGGANALEVMFGTYDSEGSPPGAAYLKAGRRTTIDSEQVAPLEVEPEWTGTASDAGSSVSVSGDTLILAANANRKFAIISNDGDDTVYLYLAASGALVNKGYPLMPGGVFPINHLFPWTGAVCGIPASGTQNVCTMEA